MRKLLPFLAMALGVYLVIRAIAEPFVVDVFDPASYAADWGGPSLAGVLLVHCGPGVVSAVLLWRAATRRGRPGRVSKATVRGGEVDHGLE